MLPPLARGPVSPGPPLGVEAPAPPKPEFPLALPSPPPEPTADEMHLLLTAPNFPAPPPQEMVVDAQPRAVDDFAGFMPDDDGDEHDSLGVPAAVHMGEPESPSQRSPPKRPPPPATVTAAGDSPMLARAGFDADAGRVFATGGMAMFKPNALRPSRPAPGPPSGIAPLRGASSRDLTGRSAPGGFGLAAAMPPSPPPVATPTSPTKPPAKRTSAGNLNLADVRPEKRSFCHPWYNPGLLLLQGIVFMFKMLFLKLFFSFLPGLLYVIVASLWLLLVLILAGVIAIGSLITGAVCNKCKDANPDPCNFVNGATGLMGHGGRLMFGVFHCYMRGLPSYCDWEWAPSPASK